MVRFVMVRFCLPGVAAGVKLPLATNDKKSVDCESR
jgi:hypothetical protein